MLLREGTGEKRSQVRCCGNIWPTGALQGQEGWAPLRGQTPGGNGLLQPWGKGKGGSTLREWGLKRPKGRSSIRRIWLRRPFQGSTTCAWSKWLQGSEKLLGYCYGQQLFNFFNLLLAVNKPCHSANTCCSNNSKDKHLQNHLWLQQEKTSFSNKVVFLIIKEIYVNWSKVQKTRNNLHNPSPQRQPLTTFWPISIWLSPSIFFFSYLW